LSACSGRLALAALGTSLLYVARLLIAYPIGWVMDTYGRKMGLFLGLVLSLLGAVTVGLAMLWASFLLFVTGCWSLDSASVRASS
jgi:MFS family permease